MADLRARRLELTRASLRETLPEGDLDRFRVVVEAIAEEFDPMEVALAAVKLAHDAAGSDAEEEGETFQAPSPETSFREKRPGRERKGARAEKGRARSRAARRRGPKPGMERLYIGAGRNARVRPQDLVGAITGEAGITGREIGAIDIADSRAIVEVAEDVAGEVVEALRAGTIKGRKVTVRRDRPAEG